MESRKSNQETAADLQAAEAAPTTATAGAPADGGGARPLAGTRATERAFVIQLAPDGDPSTAALKGRVQHLATSDGGNFGSVEGLVAIMRRVLERAAGRQRE